MSCRTPIFTAAYRPDDAERRRAESKAPSRLIHRLLDTLERWHQRNRQRTALAALDDRLLDDVGLSREAATREMRKFFWQN